MSEDDKGLRSEAARAMGQARTPAKVEASSTNLEKARQGRWADPAAKERQREALRAAHRRRKETEAAEPSGEK